MKKETGHLNSKPGNWLMSKWLDLLVLFLPVWALWIVFFSNAAYFKSIDLPLWAWVLFILGIDVSHVWSSLFRSYLVKDEFQAQKKILILAPIIAIVGSVILISISVPTFWRVMAYLAVFHFIKQQYGFVALYKLKRQEKRKQLLSDKYIIYIATIYPVVFWHFNSASNFNWFAANDFFALHTLLGNAASVLPMVFSVLNVIYWVLMAAWLLQEVSAIRKGEKVATGKLFWVLTTAVNWWFGIVYFNSDVIFSISNVVAHGIPYLALVYFYRLKKQELQTFNKPSFLWRFRWVFTLLFTVVIAALVEEYFWDMLIYRERTSFFENIYPYNWSQVKERWWLIIAMALLALPQQVHYIIDGFIWKMNSKNKYLKPIFKPNNES